MKRDNNLVQPLNIPQPIRVTTDRFGCPRDLIIRRRRHRVIALIDRWQVDEGWWREVATQRLYFRVELATGHEATLYRDLLRNEWWTQRN